jgi:aryl-alcohol dehydrogenase-like predicted oxidoreductase
VHGNYGRSPDSAVKLIRFGLDRSINIIDYVASYGTEHVVGRAIKDCRPKVILSTKALPSSRSGPARLDRADHD